MDFESKYEFLIKVISSMIDRVLCDYRRHILYTIEFDPLPDSFRIIYRFEQWKWLRMIEYEYVNRDIESVYIIIRRELDNFNAYIDDEEKKVYQREMTTFRSWLNGYRGTISGGRSNGKTYKTEETIMRSKFSIEKVIFNDPATIVIWKDGTKTIVKCGEGETFDPEKGLAMAIAKRALGTNQSKGNYYDIFKEWLPEEKNDVKEKYPVAISLAKYAFEHDINPSTLRKQAINGKIPAFKLNGRWFIRVSEFED